MGLGALMLRSIVDQEDYSLETSSFSKFKGLVSRRLRGTEIDSWCLRHQVEVIPELYKISPVEAFVVGFRTWERLLGEKGSGKEHVVKVLGRAGIEPDEDVIELLVRLGDRVPVSDNEDFFYAFPKDFYDKVLLFNMVPE